MNTVSSSSWKERKVIQLISVKKYWQTSFQNTSKIQRVETIDAIILFVFLCFLLSFAALSRYLCCLPRELLIIDHPAGAVMIHQEEYCTPSSDRHLMFNVQALLVAILSSAASFHLSHDDECKERWLHLYRALSNTMY
jgi:hypothetical protein